MPTVYVIAYVPAAARAAAESLVGPYLTGPGAVWSVPLSADGSDPPTHYGLCAPVDSGGALAVALPALAAAVPGSAYHTVPPRQYSRQRDWLDWLAARGLMPVRSQVV